MNRERHEELAALAALDLLSPPEQAELTAAIAQNPDLPKLIDSLRAAAANLAHTAPSAEPPAALKSRLLAHIAVVPAAHSRPQPSPATTADSTLLEFKKPSPASPKPKPSFFPLFSWAVAACLALFCAWVSQKYFLTQRLNSDLRDQQVLADFALRSAQNQLEAERLIAKRELADATAQLTESAQTLAALQTRLNVSEAQSRNLTAQLDVSRSELTIARNQLTDARQVVTTREQRIAELDRQLKAQGDLANYKIATLASLAGNTPQALAIAVWNPANQQGLLSVQKLPALPSDKDYQLWIIAGNSAPVSAGVFAVDATTGEARVPFRADQAIKDAVKFAISLERKGGNPTPTSVLFMGQ